MLPKIVEGKKKKIFLTQYAWVYSSSISMHVTEACQLKKIYFSKKRSL